MAILTSVSGWEPFEIDALGVVTLLGGESLQKSLGRLVVTPFAEYLPLLAAQVVLEGSIGEAIPGFVIYNVTDGIRATNSNAWWTRWLLCQELSWNSTTFDISILPTPRGQSTSQSLSAVFAVLLSGFIMAFPIIIGDWYGFACSVSIVADVVLRSIIMRMYRDCLDHNARAAEKDSKRVKLLVTLPAGKVVTVHTTSGITLKCLLTEAKPQNSFLYHSCCNLGWLCFGIYIVTLGMSCLAMQLILVACIIIPSVLVIRQIGCHESHVGSLLKIRRMDFAGKEHMARTFAALELDETEEECMVQWGHFPMRSNTKWWEKYKVFEAKYRKDEHAFDNWREKVAGATIAPSSTEQPDI